MIHRATLCGVGMYAPSRVMTNDELSTMVETSDEWIVARTGIRRRHIARPDESASSLAIHAGRAALASAGLPGSEIDLTIVATSTPDYGFPASACIVQDALGARGGAFDLEAACSGFVYALAMANSLISLGAARHALVIGSEVFSRSLNWHDRSTCVLFGDGAGAVVVSRASGPGLAPSFLLGSDGAGARILTLPALGSAPLAPGQRMQESPGMTMNGPETFKFGVRVLVETTETLLREAGLTPQEVEWLVPHQANQRIMLAGAKRLGFIDSQLMSNIEEYGNTSAASIPIAIAEWVARDLVRPGHRLAMIGFGAGLTWAGGLMTWRD
jgi:3-oxoacyl-[acyl-carrier-protein] synthase-3